MLKLASRGMHNRVKGMKKSQNTLGWRGDGHLEPVRQPTEQENENFQGERQEGWRRQFDCVSLRVTINYKKCEKKAIKKNWT